MKRTLSVVTIIVMMLSLLFCATGCGASEQEQFVGSWEAKVDFGKLVGEMMTSVEDMPEGYADNFDFGSAEITLQMTFDKDGTYEMSVDEDSAEDALKVLTEDMKEGLTKFLQGQLAASGITMSVEDALAASGMNLDDAVEKEMANLDIIDSMEKEGKYKVADGKLYTTETLDEEINEKIYEEYKLEGDTFTLTKYVGGEEDAETATTAEHLYPMEFTKVK